MTETTSPPLLDGAALLVLARISPALVEVAQGNPALDEILGKFDSVDARVRAHLAVPSLMARLEDDFALFGVPALAQTVPALESWGLPLLEVLAGPAGALLSIGVQVAVKLGLMALQAWADKRKKLAAERAAPTT